MTFFYHLTATKYNILCNKKFNLYSIHNSTTHRGDNVMQVSLLYAKPTLVRVASSASVSPEIALNFPSASSWPQPPSPSQGCLLSTKGLGPQALLPTQCPHPYCALMQFLCSSDSVLAGTHAGMARPDKPAWVLSNSH